MFKQETKLFITKAYQCTVHYLCDVFYVANFGRTQQHNKLTSPLPARLKKPFFAFVSAFPCPSFPLIVGSMHGLTSTIKRASMTVRKCARRSDLSRSETVKEIVDKTIEHTVIYTHLER